MMGNTQPKVTKVLVDADLILEIYAERRAFKEEVNKFFEMKEDLREVWVTNKCLTRVQSERDQETVDNVRILTSNCIIEISNQEREEASRTSIIDFDSAEEVICAKYQGLDAIITFNPQNFDGADFKIISLQALTDASEDLEVNNSQSIPVHLIKRIFSNLALLGIACLAILYLYDKYLNYRIIENFGLKKISRSQMDKLCRNPDYYLQIIYNQYYKNQDTTKLDFIPKGLLIKEELKKKVIPAFIARCSVNVKPKSTPQEGLETTIDIGLNMDKWICGSTDQKPIRVINLNNYRDLDSFYCANIKPDETKKD